MATKAINHLGQLIMIPDIPGLEVLAPVPGVIGTRFGVQSVTGILHRGLDVSAVKHTPIRAPRDGWVTFTYTHGREMPGLQSDGSPGGYGNQVYLDHGSGITSRHAHMTTVQVMPGARVVAGQTIGTVGTTGISTGPHLHWELRLHGMAFDPEPYIVAALTPPEEEDDELDAEDRAALDWLRANRGNLSPLAIAAREAGFTAANDTGRPDGTIAKGIRRTTRLLRALTDTVEASAGAVGAARKLAYDLSRPEGDRAPSLGPTGGAERAEGSTEL